jgi:hypothetical protein
MVLGYDSLFYLAPNYIWGFLTNRRFVKKIFWVVYTKLRISLRNKQKQNPAVWPVAHYSFVVRCLLYIRITPLAGNWCTNFMPGANISLIFIEELSGHSIIYFCRITEGLSSAGQILDAWIINFLNLAPKQSLIVSGLFCLCSDFTYGVIGIKDSSSPSDYYC